MTQPILSIIIPAYNCGDQIKTIVNSIINQSFNKWELIIVNDKSTDNTAEILAEITKLDSRIIVINQTKNGGASVARNTGIQKSRGKYIMFFDADDDIAGRTISTFVKNIGKKNTDLCVSGFTVKNLLSGKVVSSIDVCTNELPKQSEDESFKMYILKLLGLDGRLYQVWNKIYRADIIKNNKIAFQAGVNFGEDLVFNLNYFAHMTGKINFIHQPLYIYNQSLDAGTFSKSSLIYQNRQANYKELLDFMATEPDSSVKTDLLNWIQYSWLYSHFLAISLSKLSKKEKLVKLRETSKLFSYPPVGDKYIIGNKRVLVEKFLKFIIKHPRLGLLIINISNFIKHNKLTSSLWTKLRRSINS